MTMPSKPRGWPLVILAGLVLLLAFAVLMPICEIFADQSDEAAQAQRELGVYRARIAARPRLEAELNVIDRQTLATSQLLTGTNTALAAASMQSMEKDLVERHSGQVRSAQTLVASVSNGLEKVQVQYELSIPLGSLKAVTYELETKAPFLFLDDVEIRPELYAGGAPGVPGNLHVRWLVHGYRRGIEQ